MDLNRLRIDRGEAPSRRRGRLVRTIVVLALLAGAGWLFRRPLLRAYDALTLPRVAVLQAVRASPGAPAAATGTAANGYVVAARRAALSADTPGRIVEMNVEEGSVVREGDVVARLYADEYRAALQRAEAELVAARAVVGREQAEHAAARNNVEALKANIDTAESRVREAGAEMELAEIEYQRAVELHEKQAETKAILDGARARRERAKASWAAAQGQLVFANAAARQGESRVAVAAAAVAEAESRVAVADASVAQARATLDKTEVRAPFDGIVILKDAEVGEVVSPNAQGGNSRGAVVTMVDFRSLEVEVDLPETVLQSVTVGAPAAVYPDAYPGEVLSARVTRIWPTADRQKGTIEIRVGFDEPDERLRPDMAVRVVFRPEGAAEPTATEVVLAPQACVVRGSGGTGVFVVERDRVRWRRVEVGEKSGNRVVVTAGLDGGERLVADPAPDLEDGMRVRIQG